MQLKQEVEEVVLENWPGWQNVDETWPGDEVKEPIGTGKQEVRPKVSAYVPRAHGEQ